MSPEGKDLLSYINTLKKNKLTTLQLANKFYGLKENKANIEDLKKCISQDYIITGEISEDITLYYIHTERYKLNLSYAKELILKLRPKYFETK